MNEQQHPFRITGHIAPLTYGAMNKAVGAATHVPRRPLGGWLMTYGKIGPQGGIIPTVDRQGHIAEAASELGRIDWSHYLEKGLWNDTHLKDKETGKHETIVGIPTMLEFHDGTTELAKAHRKVGFWTAGHLWDRNDPASWTAYTTYVPTPKDLEKADYYWELAQLLKGTPRPIGISAEGMMALDPAERRIVYAIVKGAAVCELPQSPDTTLEPMALAAQSGWGETPLVIMAKAIGASSGSGAHSGVHSANPQVRPVVVEDLEGHPDLGSMTAADRLVHALMERYGLSKKKAETWIRRFLKRREHGQREH